MIERRLWVDPKVLIHGVDALAAIDFLSKVYLSQCYVKKKIGDEQIESSECNTKEATQGNHFIEATRNYLLTLL